MTPRRRSRTTRTAGRAPRRRIAVVTGSRAEYGLLRSTLQELCHHPRVELQLIVTGMHLLNAYGRTVREITADGWPIAARVPMQRGDDDALDQAYGLARGVRGIAAALARLRSELVVVLGDRIEAMAAALAATVTGRFLAHIHGGDRAPGDVDGPLRDAISKLAHLHLAASRRSAARLRALGEPAARIHVVGAPGLDRLFELRTQRNSARQGSRPRRLERTGEPYALVVQHPIGRPAAREQRVMTRLLDCVARTGLKRVIIQPNSDRGHTGIRAAISAHLAHAAPGEARAYASLPRDAFLQLLCGAAVLIGNSSAGLIEAPAGGVPVIDVGDRQRGREAGGPGVRRVPETTVALRQALRAALRSRGRRGTGVYGDGRAGRRIAALLARTRLTEALRKK